MDNYSNVDGLGLFNVSAGGGRLKWTLVIGSLMWAVLQWFQGLVYYYDNNMEVPEYNAIGVRCADIRDDLGDHFYCVAEKNRAYITGYPCSSRLQSDHAMFVPVLKMDTPAAPCWSL